MAKEPKYGDIDEKLNGPVRTLQKGLKASGYYKGRVDGKFFDGTLEAVNAFRKNDGLDPIVKPAPKAPPAESKDEEPPRATHEALNLALPTKKLVLPDGDPTAKGPSFNAISDEDRRMLFGQYRFRPYPAPDKSGFPIQILNDVRKGGNWEDDNIREFHCPQLVGLETGAGPSKGSIRLHKLISQQFMHAMQEIEEQGLLSLLLTCDGAFVARYIRGNDQKLSNHAYGTAVDFNAEWNGLGQAPAAVGQKGSVRLLVPIFEAFGFYWGGYFSRKDGMHFEAAKVLGLL